MSRFIQLGKVEDIPEGSARCFEVGDRAIAVFHLEDGLFAIDDECSHAAGPLSEGEIEGHEVECPWHGARFDIKTGHACTTAPTCEGVEVFPLRIEGGVVEVELRDI